ncbi:MAG: DinB family protein [Chitinophagaceae bacterium]|nr:DinB family protein [Chitinophagaceae bacterium]
MSRPDLSTAPEWFHGYINAVKENDLTEALRNQTALFNTFFESLPVEKREFSYAEGKWSIKEIIQHIIDGERVFTYRALRFARKDETPLPGFDENTYADNAKTDKRKWDDLIEEFNALRRSTEILFNSFDEDQLNATGIASGNPVSVLAIGFIVAGHVNHHISIIKARYL